MKGWKWRGGDSDFLLKGVGSHQRFWCEGETCGKQSLRRLSHCRAGGEGLPSEARWGPFLSLQGSLEVRAKWGSEFFQLCWSLRKTQRGWASGPELGLMHFMLKGLSTFDVKISSGHWVDSRRSSGRENTIQEATHNTHVDLDEQRDANEGETRLEKKMGSLSQFGRT